MGPVLLYGACRGMYPRISDPYKPLRLWIGSAHISLPMPTSHSSTLSFAESHRKSSPLKSVDESRKAVACQSTLEGYTFQLESLNNLPQCEGVLQWFTRYTMVIWNSTIHLKNGYPKVHEPPYQKLEAFRGNM